MTQIANELAVFAERRSIDPAHAYVLPAVFRRVADRLGMEERALLSMATYSNEKLGQYLADVAREVAEADTRQHRAADAVIQGFFGSAS